MDRPNWGAPWKDMIHRTQRSGNDGRVGNPYFWIGSKYDRRFRIMNYQAENQLETMVLGEPYTFRDRPCCFSRLRVSDRVARRGFEPGWLGLAGHAGNAGKLSLPIRPRHSTMRVMTRKIARAFAYSVFYEQAAEGGYVATVPALPGCHTQGETLEETERNVKEAIALYLESLADHGEAIPEEGPSFQGRVTVPVPVPA